MKRNRLTYLLAFTALTMLSSASHAEDPNQDSSDGFHAAGIAGMAGLVFGTHNFVQAVRRTRQIDSTIYHNELEMKRNLATKDFEKVKALKLENKALSKEANYAVAKVAASFIAVGSVPFLVNAVLNGHQISQNLEKAKAGPQSNTSETSTPQTATARAAQ